MQNSLLMTGLFFTIAKDKRTANALNNDIFLISVWAFNWKLLFKCYSQGKINLKLIPPQVSIISKQKSVIKYLRYSLPRKSLVTISKAFLQTPIDYEDVIYDRPQNENFCEKLESIQYKAMLAITRAIQGTSCENIY